MEINFKGLGNLKSAKEVVENGVNKMAVPSLSEIVSKSREKLTEVVERMVPENGKFFQVGVTFDIPDTFNEAIVKVIHDAEKPKNLRRLVVEMHHQNSDKMFSVFTKKGTKAEIMEYLKQQNTESDILKHLTELSKTMEEHYSSL